MKEIVINWHIIQKCNYNCYYCFAKYDKNYRKDICESKQDIEEMLKDLYCYYSSEYSFVRLNIAGGEPTLVKNLSFIIEVAYKMGFIVSLITNASKITTRFIELNAKYLCIFAVSVDSVDEKEKVLIGRTSKNNTLATYKIIKYIEEFKKLNPSIKIKINTVVNEHNYKSYLGDFINLIKPDKWKVLQALSLSKSVYCTDDMLDEFVRNHKNIMSDIYIEQDNDMIDSYIMIDPNGRFYQNTNGYYDYSESILHVGTKVAFNMLNFDKKKFQNRYKTGDIK